jgi:acetyl-CoA C-acetyltransferase
MKDSDIVIVAYARTAFDKFGGVTRNVHSSQYVAWVIQELIKRSGLQKGAIDFIHVGSALCVEQGIQTDIQGRQGLLLAGMPPETLSFNIDRACCSSTTALQQSFLYLKQGLASVCMSIGADNMSNTPLLLSSRLRWEGYRLGNVSMTDVLFPISYPGYAVAVDAGEVAVEYGQTREMQDDWALHSQLKAGMAIAGGFLKEEVFPIEIPQGKGKAPVIFAQDSQPRPDVKIEDLAKMPTVYGSPTVTAGNAPSMNSGGSGVVVTTRKKAKELELEPLAEILDVVSIALSPKYIASAPAEAINKGLSRTGLKLDDLKQIEINEAFAAVPLVSTHLLAGGDKDKTKKIRDITNPNGGAIAFGHPVGASGLRITSTIINNLRRQGGGYGVAAICGGLAQGDAVILKI